MFYFYSNYIAPASVIIPLAIGLCCYKKTNIGHRFLLSMLGFSALTTIIGKIFAIIFHNNIIVNQIYTVGEFLFLAGFYYCQFQSTIMKRVILTMIIVFSIFAIYLIVIFIGVIRFDDYAPSVESILIIFLSIALFNGSNDSLLRTTAWHQDPTNWFNTGILLYFSGSLFIFLLSNYVTDPKTLIYAIVWNVQITFLLLLSLLFAIGFYKVEKAKLSSL
jgi:hypothetical protein